MSSGRLSPAVEHWSTSLEIEPNQPLVLNNLAWLFSVYPDQDFYNPAEAVRLAEKACDLTEHSRADFLDTLAVCCASVGRFDDAVKAARKAIELAIEADRHDIVQAAQDRLGLYQAHKPYYESIEKTAHTKP